MMGDLATYSLAYGDMLKEKLQTEARLCGRKVMTKATAEITPNRPRGLPPSLQLRSA
jgi:hypothetical protein